MNHTAVPDEGPEQTAPDITPADIRGVLAGLGVDSRLTTGADGRPDIRLDRSSLEQLRDAASAHGAFTIAGALEIALAEGPDNGEAS